VKETVLGMGVALVLTAGTVMAGPGDGGVVHGRLDAGPRETANQRAYRVAYIEQTVSREREITAHHVWTPEMSNASWTHWHRAYRALRIRDLAQDDNEAATVARVDAYLSRLTDHFLTLLQELTAKSPEVPPPPTLLSPSASASLPIGTAVTFKLAPYKDAMHYYCWLWEPGGHYWSNWQVSTESYGTSPECTIAADDPRWSAFRAGKVEFHGRAILSAKSTTGKDYRIWSEPVKAEFALTGGAAPTVSGTPRSAGPPATTKPSSSAGAGGSK
jgi:hypothetical protein